MIFDSDIAIWMLRKHGRALRFAETLAPRERVISAISNLELLYGCRNQKEVIDLREFLVEWFTEITPITPRITEYARELMETFVLSHRPDPADVLIATTALERGEQLITCNGKHFNFIPGLEVKIFRP